MVYKFNCYDCEYSSDKCKNKGCDQYNCFVIDIEKCSIAGKVDNSLGRSTQRGDDSI